MENKKGVALFFLFYVLLLTSIITAVVLNPVKLNEVESLEVKGTTFAEELKRYEEKRKQEELLKKQEKGWEVSNELAVTAITLGSILDIVIVLLWARSENRKREGIPPPDKKRWRDSKIFWNIVAMGVVQPKGHKLKVNWLNMIGVFLLIHLFFYILFLK